jgi:tRNA (cytidine/uridine-2'-O-)-methyltransferase
VVLLEPQIPPNTGNIARLCAATGCRMILVGELGFELSDRALKRAGLDYWEHVEWEHVPDAEGFFAGLPQDAFHLFTTRATRPYTQFPAVWGDYVVFGKETAGLPAELLEAHPDRCYTIPMLGQGVRSLNLSSAVSIVLYDGLRRVRPFAAPE